MSSLQGALSGEQLFWIVIAALGGLVILGCVVGECFTARTKARARLEQTHAHEETRRELAAYVAEGSMSPEDAARILVAGPDRSRGSAKS